MIVALVAVMFILTGCGSAVNISNTDYNNGERKIYLLDELYESGEISRQDLLTIAYYANDFYQTNEISEEYKKAQYPENFVPTVKDRETLDDKTTDEIEKAFYDYVNYNYSGEVTGVKYRGYFGKYGDYLAVSIRINGGWYETRDYFLDGVIITFPTLQMELYLFKL